MRRNPDDPGPSRGRRIHSRARGGSARFRTTGGALRARRREFSARRYGASARARLSRFRQASMLAIGATALALLLVGDPATPAPAAEPEPGLLRGATFQTADPAPQDPDLPAQGTVGDTLAPGAEAAAVEQDSVADPEESARRATGTLRQLAREAYGILPAILIALGLLLVAGLLARLVRSGLRAALASWERAEAIAALVAIFIWLFALGAALSVLAGDARALVGSLGLFGLALSWALQTPIESFTGWLLNSFRSYYRVGDRISVGEVFGDVARIDFLTTTVFEAGGPDKRVQAAQSTGALVTFPNSEVLRSNITNFTRDFPFVWDELTVAVTNESDLPHAMDVLEQTAYDVVGERMEDAAEQYGTLLERARLSWDVATRPEVFAAPRDSWTDLTIRYMVPAREMRRWSSILLVEANRALAAPEVARRVFPAYPRTQMQPLPVPYWAQPSPEDDDEHAGPEMSS